MKSDRLTILSQAFRAVPLQCGPWTLRPITAGSVLLLMDTGNAIFSGKEADEAEQLQGLFEFVWIHGGPEDEVLADCQNREVLHQKARKLALGISFEDLATFTEQFQAVQQRLAAATVEILPEKGEAPGKSAAMPHPTGSPASSTPSEEPETRSGNGGSFGDSPSTVPCNTCTLPTAQTEPAAAGRSRIWEPEPEDGPQDLGPNVIPLP